MGKERFNRNESRHRDIGGGQEELRVRFDFDPQRGLLAEMVIDLPDSPLVEPIYISCKDW